MKDKLRRGPGGGGHRHDREALESRFALRVAARLSEQADALPHDVSERLRFAREKALERVRAAGVAVAVPLPARAVAPVRALAGTGRGGPGGPPSSWWLRLASALPLVALIGGLVLIQQQHLHQQIAAAAEIDTDLLTDALPPTAYGDAGFVEFLKAPQN